MPPAKGTPRCREGKGWIYSRPAWADSSTLYALRRSPRSKAGNWDQLVRLRTEAPGSNLQADWKLDPEPVRRGDIVSFAVEAEPQGGGRLALILRPAGNAGLPHVEVMTGREKHTGPPAKACEVVWGGASLFVSFDSCVNADARGTFSRVDPAKLDAAPLDPVDGRDPAAVAAPGG
jgi:hypothetical protein